MTIADLKLSISEASRHVLDEDEERGRVLTISRRSPPRPSAPAHPAASSDRDSEASEYDRYEVILSTSLTLSRDGSPQRSLLGPGLRGDELEVDLLSSLMTACARSYGTSAEALVDAVKRVAPVEIGSALVQLYGVATAKTVYA